MFTRTSGILLLALVGGSALARDGEYINDALRIQVLGRDIVRIEERGPKGFEDRPTLKIRTRPRPVAATVKREGDADLILMRSFRVRVPRQHPRISAILIESNGESATLPQPGEVNPRHEGPYVLSDAERTAISDKALDYGNAARDIYLIGSAEDQNWRKPVLKITGGIPLPHVSLLGIINQQPGTITQSSIEESIAAANGAGFLYSAVAIPRPWDRRSHEEWPNYESFAQAMASNGVVLLGNELRTERRPQISSFETPLSGGTIGWITDDPALTYGILPSGRPMETEPRKAVILRAVEALRGAGSFPTYREIGGDCNLGETLKSVLVSGENLDPFRIMTLRDDGLEPAQRVRAEQLAAFMPVVIDESMTPPWTLSSPATSIVKAARQLRERLLPLRYSLAVEAVAGGIPPLRSMALAYPAEEEAKSCDSQFMLGEDLLVAPSLNSSTQKVWIPPGRWADLGTGNVRVGPKFLEIEPTLTRTPMFLREGAPLALGDERVSLTSGAWKRFELIGVLPEADGRIQRSVIEDDGQTLGWMAGQSQRTRYSLERKGNRAILRVEAKTGGFEGCCRDRDWQILLHLPGGTTVSKVIADGVVRDVERFRSCGRSQGVHPLMGKGGSFTAGGMVEVTVPRQPGTYAFQIVYLLSRAQPEGTSTK